MKLNNALFRDPEFWFIILFNALLVYAFFYSNYDARLIVWGYFIQSVFIGFEYVAISLTKIFKKDKSFLPLSKLSIVGFFTLHFGLFHFVYFIFLIASSSSKDDVEAFFSLVKFVRATIGYLILNALFLIGREWIPGAPDYPKPSIIAAYVRISPIHLFIMLNSFSGGINQKAFVVFMLLKLFGDLLIYILFSHKSPPKAIK